MTNTETISKETDQMLTDLIGTITNEIEARQATGDDINQTLRTVLTVAYQCGAESRQPEIDELEEALDILVRSDR